MFRSFLLVTTILFLANISSAQITYYVQDAVSNEPLSNVLVHYGENSIYSNAEGSFQLPEQFKDGELVLDGLGYQLKTVSISDIENYKIFLTKKTQFLETVVLKGDPIKVRKIKQKPSKKKHWLDGVPLYHGQEYGIWIPKKDENTDVRLMNLIIPVIKKNADFEKLHQDQKRNPNKNSYSIKRKKWKTKFLFRIQFYEMSTDSSFVKLDYLIKEFVVSSEDTKYEINYEHDDITFPSNGILVSILNMGPCDENGKMLSMPRFLFKEVDGELRKFINNINDVPLIALHSKAQQNVLDYHHPWYSEKSKWIRVVDGLYPRTVGGPMKQLGLGYEIEVRYYD